MEMMVQMSLRDYKESEEELKRLRSSLVAIAHKVLEKRQRHATEPGGRFYDYVRVSCIEEVFRDSG